MKGRFITAKAIAEFKEHLILEERSEITVEKYIRDVKAFSAYTQNSIITKETVIAYKKHLQENYAVRSVSRLSDLLANIIIENQINVLDIESKKILISDILRKDLNVVFDEYGLIIPTNHFNLTNNA